MVNNYKSLLITNKEFDSSNGVIMDQRVKKYQSNQQFTESFEFGEHSDLYVSMSTSFERALQTIVTRKDRAIRDYVVTQETKYKLYRHRT